MTTAPNDAPHLQQTVNDRGLAYLPSIPTTRRGRNDGSNIDVHTSSAATGPHVWIGAVSPVNQTKLVNYDQPGEHDLGRATLHFLASDALRFADQIVETVATHYQLAGLDGIELARETAHDAIARLIAIAASEEPDEG